NATQRPLTSCLSQTASAVFRTNQPSDSTTAPCSTWPIRASGTGIADSIPRRVGQHRRKRSVELGQALLVLRSLSWEPPFERDVRLQQRGVRGRDQTPTAVGELDKVRATGARCGH